MVQPTNLTANTDNCAAEPHAVLDALQMILADVDAFMSAWFQRLEQQFVLCEVPTTANELLNERVEEFQQRKSQWDSKRKREEQQIQEKVEQLTEAWLRLETEQRRFLQIKETHVPANSDTTQRDSTGLTMPQANNDSKLEQSFSVDRGSINANTAAYNLADQGHRSREAAVRQFQRLRQEIESSRPNSDVL